MASPLKSSALTQFIDTKTTAALLRIATAFLMIYHHGFGKLMNVLGGNFQFLDPLGIGPEASLILATLAEAICAFLVLIGFWTRGAALILVLNMAVAVLFHHLPSGDGFAGIELPLIYLVSFFIIFLLGPGKFSLDNG
ncbi:MAG TPA: DoxX family protein [Fodinibius sp.]|nr:DoxX family protein [Fodinibius sp.]